jgi:hypothetical protein
MSRWVHQMPGRHRLNHSDILGKHAQIGVAVSKLIADLDGQISQVERHSRLPARGIHARQSQLQTAALSRLMPEYSCPGNPEQAPSVVATLTSSHHADFICLNTFHPSPNAIHNLRLLL